MTRWRPAEWTKAAQRDALILAEMNLDTVDRDTVIDAGLCHRPGQDVDVFYPSDEYGRFPPFNDRRWRPALAICGECPVRIQCLAVAIRLESHDAGGVWGGLQIEERKAIAERLGSRASTC